MWQKNWKNLREQLDLINTDDSKELLRILINSQIDIEKYCKIFNQTENLEYLILLSPFDYNNIKILDYSFNIDWEDIDLEITVFTKNTPKTLKEFIGKLGRLLHALFIYKSKIECPNCSIAELSIYKNIDNKIFYECELCLNLYDSNLTLYQDKIKLYPCDVVTLKINGLYRY